MQQRAAGLLLWAQLAGYRSTAIGAGRPAARRTSAANASSVTLSADVGS